MHGTVFQEYEYTNDYNNSKAYVSFVGRPAPAADTAASEKEFCIHVRLGTRGNKAIFLLGILIGGFLVRKDWISPNVKQVVELLRGYEYDSAEGCVVMRGKKSRAGDWCRPLINCSMCKDVHGIDIVQVSIKDLRVYTSKVCSTNVVNRYMDERSRTSYQY